MADTVPATPELTQPGTQTPAPDGQGRRAAAFSSLRHRNFQLFFSGQMISLVGTWMQSVAKAWLVYRLSGSAVLLGVLGFVNQIPIFLLSPVGGLVADRWRRQRVVIGTQISSMMLAFTLATLTLSGRVRVWEIITLSGMLGVVNAFDVPARQAFLIEMVGREDLLNAIALNSSMFNGARVAGPAIAGILVAWIGEGWCFLLNGVSYLAVIAGLLMIRIGKPLVTEGSGSPFERLKEGFRFARQALPIRALLLLLAVVSLTAMPFTVLMPIFADRVLHGGVSAYGTLMGAIGVGAVMGAMILAVRQQLKGLGRIVSFAAISFGAALVLFGASRWYWASLLILTGAGLAMMLQFTSTNTLLQAMVPDQLRGRIMSLYSMMFLGTTPLGALAVGATAAHIGAPLTVAIEGGISLAAGIVFAREWPSVRGSARELVAAQGMIRPVAPQDPSAPPS